MTDNKITVSVSETLSAVYREGRLIRRATNEQGDPKVISFARLAKYLALSMEDLIKPFNYTTSDNRKYAVRVLEFNDDTVTLLFSARETHFKPLEFTQQFKKVDRRMLLGEDNTGDLSPEDTRSILTRIWATSKNLPIAYMLRHGIISTYHAAQVVFTYLAQKSQKEGINLPPDVYNTLGQLLWSELSLNPVAENYSLSEFFDTYMLINWDLVSELTRSPETPKVVSLPATIQAKVNR